MRASGQASGKNAVFDGEKFINGQRLSITFDKE